MFKELYDPLPDTQSYLERIGYRDPVKNDRNTLDGLIWAHLHTVPFENLDIFDYGLEIPLGIDMLFDKMVVRRRGGYCFELNALFMSLLTSVGFECYPVSARVLWKKDYLSPPGHRATVVIIDGVKWFADVGFGGPTPMAGLRMGKKGVQQSPGGEFSFERSPYSMVFLRHSGGTTDPVLMIDDRPCDPVDFIPLNEYFSKNSASHFKSKRMVNLSTADGSVSIDGDILRVHRGAAAEETVLASEVERTAALKEYFGIHIGEREPIKRENN